MHGSLALRSRVHFVAGLRVFFLVWFGQLVSVLGSGLTSFALGLWAYQRSGSVADYSTIALAAVIPRILLSPLAGVVADRYNRRLVMIVSDLGAGLSTLVVALLLFTGRLEIWHLWLTATWSSACGAFQWPAYSAATSQLVPAQHLARVNGLVGIVRAVTEIFAPALAGLLVVSIGIAGVLLVDAGTFLFAIATLVLVRFPPLPLEETSGPAGQEGAQRGAFWQNVLFGWRYVAANPGLMVLLFFLALFTFLQSTVGVLVVPLALNFTTPQGLGALITIAGTGMLLGSLIMAAWGGPKRRIYGMIAFEVISGLSFLLMGLQPLFWMVALGAFGAHFAIAFIDGSNKAIWQVKVPQALQGRVFAVWQMVTLSAAPLAYLSAGRLGDEIFEPWMRAGAPGLPMLADLLGSGPGRGIGLMFVLMGVLKVLVAFACLLPRKVRHIEDL